MDRTVSRRSEPSSRSALMGEQPNPWDVLPPQDAKHINPLISQRYRLYHHSKHFFLLCSACYECSFSLKSEEIQKLILYFIEEFEEFNQCFLSRYTG